MQDPWKPTSWNNHPLNRKAKTLLDEVNRDAFPEGLYLLQLAEWGIENLPEYQHETRLMPSMPHLPRENLQGDLIDLINDLMNNHSQKQAMEFLMETPWDESDKALPTFQQIKTPQEGAEQVLENLTERMRWWTAHHRID